MVKLIEERTLTRRGFLGTALAAAALSGSAWGREAARLRVAKLDFFTTRVGARAWLLFRLTDDDGRTGLGDATHAAREPKLATAVGRRLFEQALRGRSIFAVESLRQAAFPLAAKAQGKDFRPHVAAFAGLEQALYDLQGKALGVPCYQLFGGKLRDEVRNYANINRMTRGDERTPEGFSRSAKRAVQAGFDAFKLASFDHIRRGETDAVKLEREIERGIEMAQAVRDVIGPNRDLLLDGHSKFGREKAIEVARRLEPLKLFWLEEVTPGIENLAAVNRAAKTPTAGGESLFGVKGFLPYIQGRAVDIVMPDVKFCGGMLELKKIAAMAEAAGMACSPHGPASPIGNMAAAHVCASMPNFQILEYAYGEVDWRHTVSDPAEPIHNGRLTVLDRPGIGYEMAGDRWRPYAGA